MGMKQDPEHPSGVVSTAPRGNHELSRARQRKLRAAISLKGQGLTWDEIAEHLGYPNGEICRVNTEKALEDNILSTESQEFLRAIAAERLEKLVEAVLPDALDPDHPEQMTRHTAARATIKDQADLLGFRAPQQFVVNNPTASQIERWVSQIASAETAQVEERDIFEPIEMEQGEDGVFLVTKKSGDDDAPPAE